MVRWKTKAIEIVKKTDLPADQRLKITEIFFSLQGEADSVGWPTVFVRLTGCPLRCQYCDTEYAFYGGEWWSFGKILEDIRKHPTQRVCVTGGEPLAQKNCIGLLKNLCDAGFSVSLETSGAMDIANVDRRVVRVLDLKTPGSGEVERNLWENLDELTDKDQIKFVICSREDYEWVKALIVERELYSCCSILLSPSFDQQDATELAEWILEDGLRVRYQLQIHKFLWGDAPGH